MTNIAIIVLSTSLQTNWSNFVTFERNTNLPNQLSVLTSGGGIAIKEATVIRTTDLGMKLGDETIGIGQISKFVGYVKRRGDKETFTPAQ